MRRIAVAVFLGGGMGLAQSKLPAISPTAAAPSSAAAVASPPATAQSDVPANAQSSQPAQVTYSPGLLEVDADNSSLNQILSEIGRQTGMKITGGVADERVFGKYGPAAPADVLASLLDGTNTNMILRETASSAPKELILTPREGGVTPPDLNSVTTNGGSPSAQAAALQRPNGDDRPGEVGSPRPPYAGGMNPPNSAPNPSAPGPYPGYPSYTPHPDPAHAPGGAQTPQQIYQQLQQMQQTQPRP